MLELLAPISPGPTVVADALLAEYVAYLAKAGYVDRKVRMWGARRFLSRYPDLVSWREATLSEQQDLPRAARYFANYLFLKHHLRPTMAYLLVARPKLALAGQKAIYPEVYAQFRDLGRRLGYADSALLSTIHFLFYVMAYVGKTASALTPADLLAFEREMRAYQPPPELVLLRRTASNHFFRLCQLLYHAGVLPSPALRYQPFPARSREVLWAGIPSPICQVVWRYLDQLATVRTVATVINHEGYLRRFFAWLAREHPEVQHLREIARSHIEAFKRWLHSTPCSHGKPYQRPTIAGTIGTLRRFLQTIQEWGWPETPTRVLVFASDRPNLDDPLPRFLDDAQAAALMQAARHSDDLFTRVCVEALLRTGLRKGEFVQLQVNSVVKVGETYWLHVPLGKLHTDRYIPLHPEVRCLFDQWLVHRGNGPRTNDLFVIHGRRVTLCRVDAAVKRAARAAGLDEHVTPHRLRHTLATQAINRGMSLEAIAALLGHRSLSMTLVYARIANQTVREQYVAVSADLDALYADAVLKSSASPHRDPATDGQVAPGEDSASRGEKTGSSKGPSKNRTVERSNQSKTNRGSG